MSSRVVGRVWVLVSTCIVVWLGAVRLAKAHENAPAVLALKQVDATRFLAVWTPPFPPIDELTVHLPPGCVIDGAQSFEQSKAPLIPTTMTCEDALVGEITFTVGPVALGPIAVNVEWSDGTQSMHLSRGTPAAVALGGTSGSTDVWQVFRDYVGLGVEHILLGPDHLLFVLGLLVLVAGWRTLLFTVSAFTLAHSVTLVAATLGFVQVSTAPVEICIALSILLLAVEAVQTRETLTRRKPWLVAFGFGLLHGLGFASALSDVGLPRHAVASSLLAFNVGVELGQLAVVGTVLGLYAAFRLNAWFLRWSRWAAVSVLTSSSAFWLLQRVEAWLRDLGLI